MATEKDVTRLREALAGVEAAIKKLDTGRAKLRRDMTVFGPTATAGSRKRARRELGKADKYREELIKSRDDCKAALAAAQ